MIGGALPETGFNVLIMYFVNKGILGPNRDVYGPVYGEQEEAIVSFPHRA